MILYILEGKMKKLCVEDCNKVANSRKGKCISKIYINNSIKMEWECEKAQMEGHNK